MSERKPNGDISYIDLRFTFCKAKPQDASLFFSPINPAIWVSLSDELPTAAGYPIDVALE